MTLTKVLENIDAYALLEKGWDSYGADAFSKLCIDNCKLFANELDKHGVEIIGLSAGCDMYIMFTLTHKYDNIEVHDDGAMLVAAAEGSAKEWIEFDKPNIPQVAKWLAGGGCYEKSPELDGISEDK